MAAGPRRAPPGASRAAAMALGEEVGPFYIYKIFFISNIEC